MMLTGFVFIGAMAAGLATLYGRASAEKSPNGFPPVSVETQPIEIRGAYFIEERFVGLLEPARHTRLAFERTGLVTEILFEEGANVAMGDVVARLDVSKLRSERRGLEARLNELKARYDLASATLSRQGALKAKGWQSEQKFDEARFTAAQLFSAIRNIQASIESIDVDISNSELRAPYSGAVASRAVDEGSVVNPGTPIVDLMETKSRHARVGVSADAAEGVRYDQNYQLVSRGRNLEGVLISKRPDLQTGSRTVTLIFDVKGAGDIRFGDIIELVVQRSVPAHGAWLPLAALTEGPKGLWSVFIIDNKDQVQSVAREAVEVLHVEDQRVYVRGHLTSDSKIVVSGTNRIIPGQPVALLKTSAGI